MERWRRVTVSGPKPLVLMSKEFGIMLGFAPIGRSAPGKVRLWESGSLSFATSTSTLHLLTHANWYPDCPEMATKYGFAKSLRELRFLFCQTSEHSAATRCATLPPRT